MKQCFISSTIHDLKDLRNNLCSDLSKHGYQMLLSEKGMIPADSSMHSYDSCIKAAKECDLLVAVIDGRYGGSFKDSGKSITQVEVEAALDAGRQVRMFVRQSVWDAKEILRPYLESRQEFMPTKIVSDGRVFDVIDALKSRLKGNWIFQFNSPSDILEQLGHQFGFEPSLPSDQTAINKLDKKIGSEILHCFPEDLIQHLYRGFQLGKVIVGATEQLDSGLMEFYAETMRFADNKRNKLLMAFLKAAGHLNGEAPCVFKPGLDPDYYVWFRVEGNGQFELDERQSAVGKMAVHMEKAWRNLIVGIRSDFPDLILAIHQTERGTASS